MQKIRKYTIVAESEEHLKSLIEEHIRNYGERCDLNHIDVSNINNMSLLFSYSKFDGDISQWAVSEVNSMSGMFAYSKFNGDISNWDVSNVTNMQYMFAYSQFNRDISSWEVSKVTDMYGMFMRSVFNCDISEWNVSSVEYIENIFKNCENETVPYWAKIEGKENRCSAVIAFMEKKLLSEKVCKPFNLSVNLHKI